MKTKLIGIDLAKNVFQVCVLNDGRKASIEHRKLTRAKFIRTMVHYEPTTIAMEACAGAHYWGRRFATMGHEVKLLPAQHVKAFRRVHKSDRCDALAIVEAAQRPGLHPVAVKSIAQQDLHLLCTLHSDLIGKRTALINQARGFASEYGVVLATGRRKLMAELPMALEDAENALSSVVRKVLHDLYLEIVTLDQRIETGRHELEALAGSNPAYARLQTIPGFGPIVAAVFLAAIGNGTSFRRGRDVAAWLGLVPRQHSTGGRDRLGAITKNGDRSVRVSLIHGARAVLRWAQRHDHAQSRWLLSLKQRRGANRTVVAFANKLARIAWAVLVSGREFDLQRAFRPQAEPATGANTV
jgi:transposase